MAAAMPKPGDEPGGHQHLHAHTAARLSDRQTHCSQIAVCTLSDFQKSQRTKDPEEDVALPRGQCASIGNKAANGGVEGAQEPHIQNQQQQLGAYHPAPGLEYAGCGFRCSHRIGQWRCVTEHANEHIAFHCFQQQLKIVPAQRDHHDDE